MVKHMVLLGVKLTVASWLFGWAQWVSGCFVEEKYVTKSSGDYKYHI